MIIIIIYVFISIHHAFLFAASDSMVVSSDAQLYGSFLGPHA